MDEDEIVSKDTMAPAQLRSTTTDPDPPAAVRETRTLENCLMTFLNKRAATTRQR